MYMSRILLDLSNRETLRALAFPNLFHGAAEDSFTIQNQRHLWRVDHLGDNCYLLLVSQELPDLQHISAQFGFSNQADAFQSKDYTPFLNRLEGGQRWQFRLQANPVRSSAKDALQDAPRGKIHAHVTQEQQRQWLLDRQERYGFMLEPAGFDVVHTQWRRFKKGLGQTVTLKTAAFEGILTVKDADLLRKSLTQGIGRAKAYGCGLLTLIPPKRPDHG